MSALAHPFPLPGQPIDPSGMLRFDFLEPGVGSGLEFLDTLGVSSTPPPRDSDHHGEQYGGDEQGDEERVE